MPIRVIRIDDTLPHRWALLEAEGCDLTDPEDALVSCIVGLVRTSYGEDAILAAAVDIATGLTFEIQHLIVAIRTGLPDPIAEGNKPETLTASSAATSRGRPSMLVCAARWNSRTTCRSIRLRRARLRWDKPRGEWRGRRQPGRTADASRAWCSTTS